ncbi:RagB/SusD family nutrient uptake outer membrane protein, partial [Bacteroides fragilis]|nr:RagB/SusD family nutrient uptake outer membrane protein [Bacteroides fragilis]
MFATALVVGFSSCSDFLDRYPQEELSDGSFWKTPDDANKVVSDLYGYLSTWDQDNDINSDNAT